MKTLLQRRQLLTLFGLNEALNPRSNQRGASCRTKMQNLVICAYLIPMDSYGLSLPLSYDVIKTPPLKSCTFIQACEEYGKIVKQHKNNERFCNKLYFFSRYIFQYWVTFTRCFTNLK